MGIGASIVGIGTSREFGRDLGSSPLRLQFESFRAALADSGLNKADVTGLVTAWGEPRGVDYDEFAIAAGLDVRWATQLWTHGRWAATSVQQAVMAVSLGMADVVAVINSAVSGAGYARHYPPMASSLGGVDEARRDLGGPYGNWTIHGTPGAGAGAALAAQQYMDRYGATSDDMAVIPVTQRAYAHDNPLALLRDEPLSYEDYFAQPKLFGELRAADMCEMVEGSTCILVTTPERAADLDRPAVHITGIQGMQAGRENAVFFSRPGMGAGTGSVFEYKVPDSFPVFEMAGVSRDDVDGFYTYDPFSAQVWMALERWGYVQPGEAAAYCREEGVGLDSRLPMNTSGGSLAEGHLYGYGHMLEMVRQLRGEAGRRQIEGAKVLQWGAPWGDSLVMTNERS